VLAAFHGRNVGHVDVDHGRAEAPERLKRSFHRGGDLRVAVVVEKLPRPADPQAGDRPLERADVVGNRARLASRVARVGARNHLEQQCTVFDGASERPDGVERER
jgi:hypothetical protein